MKTRKELEAIENLVKRTYNKRHNRLREFLGKPYNPANPELGYSWKFFDPETNVNVYNVVVADLGSGLGGPEATLRSDTEYYIKLHEYGHIYLSHFEGIHEELDKNIAKVFQDYRGQLIDQINADCGIDFAEKLIERVIDDPVLNHSLHNIAMDMEVNSKILDKDCVEIMEKGVTSVMPKLEEQALEELKAQAVDEETKKQIDEELDRLSKESKIKFILPERYGFPDGHSYPEYLLMIIKNLDKFVKMLVSIASGGNGSVGDITTEQVKGALSGGMKSLSDLMRQLGMSDEGESEGDKGDPTDGDGKGNELSNHDSSNSGGFKWDSNKKLSPNQGVRDLDYMKLPSSKKDHGSDSRDQADVKRKLGQIKAGGGAGCGNEGGSFGEREVTVQDPVDEAIDEVIMKTKSKVIKRTVVRDVMRNYNLGRIRSVIAPSIIAKNRISTKPKIVYLIDISGSMDTVLIDRILATISKKMKQINRGLTYDIITWNTSLGEHIKDIKAGEKVRKIRTGGGTRMAQGIAYFKKHYDENCILIVASDFEDYLEEWNNILSTMSGYTVYGFNYGRSNYDINWSKNFVVKNFNRSYESRW